MKICIDPGHGPTSNLGQIGYYEGYWMWFLAQYEKAEFEARGHTVIVTRPDMEDNPDLSVRGKMAAGCDIFMADHSNANGNAAVRGVSIYDSVADELDYLEVPLCQTISAVMGTPDLGVKHRESNVSEGQDYYGVLRSAVAVGCPDAFLIEHGYHTNLADATWLKNHENLKQLARAKVPLIIQLYNEKHGISSGGSGGGSSGGGEDVLSKGDKGDMVVSWQKALLKAGFFLPKYGADGDFGAETETATKAYQSSKGLASTGIVTTPTFCAMTASLLKIEADTKSLLDTAKIKIAQQTTDLAGVNNQLLIANDKIANVRSIVS